MKISYFVHGRGRGHANRALSVINILAKRKHSIMCFAGRDAFEVLSDIENVEYIDSILPGSSPVSIWNRLKHDYQSLKADQPDFIISDGDAPVVWVGKMLRIPVIAIGHGMVYPYGIHPFELDTWGALKEKIKVKFAAGMADFSLIVHFAPLPLKISSAFMVKPDFLPKRQHQTKPYVISYFRDGNGENVVKSLVSEGLVIHNFGKPIKITGVLNFNLSNRDFKEQMLFARGIVGSSGSNLIFEGMSMKKPMLLVYQANDFEQSSNVKYVEYLNVGQGMPFNRVVQTKINQFVNNVTSQQPIENMLDVMPNLSEKMIQIIEQHIP